MRVYPALRVVLTSELLLMTTSHESILQARRWLTENDVTSRDDRLQAPWHRSFSQRLAVLLHLIRFYSQKNRHLRVRVLISISSESQSDSKPSGTHTGPARPLACALAVASFHSHTHTARPATTPPSWLCLHDAPDRRVAAEADPCIPPPYKAGAAPCALAASSALALSTSLTFIPLLVPWLGSLF